MFFPSIFKYRKIKENIVDTWKLSGQDRKKRQVKRIKNQKSEICKKMEILEYMSKNKPKGRRSLVSLYHNDILELKRAGYSLEQMKEYLEANGVNVVASTLSKYFKRHFREQGKKPPALEGNNKNEGPKNTEVEKALEGFQPSDTSYVKKLLNRKKS